MQKICSLSLLVLFFLSGIGFSAPAPATANKVTINIQQSNQAAAKEIGISFTPKIKSTSHSPAPQIMDQVNTQFQPHVLMVQKGAKVSFPNSDSVKHHVYSFSKAKPFELKLYRDRKPDPLPFEKTGDVTLGCNIHDWMVGYIYVVDTPFFGKSDETGALTIDLPVGEYTLTLHSPQLQAEDKKITKVFDSSKLQNIEISLSQPLLKTKAEFESSDEFDAY